jgi:hypothetical protein
MAYVRRLRSYDTKKARAECTLSRWGVRRWRNRWRNERDPITQEPPEPPIYRHVSDRGHVTAFNAPTLLQYIVATGNFEHPETRTPFTRNELSRISRDSKSSVSLPLERTRLEREKLQRQERNGLVEYLGNAVGELVAFFVGLSEKGCTTSRDHAYGWMFASGFVDLFESLQNLYRVDPGETQVVVNNNLAFIKLAAEDAWRYDVEMCACITKTIENWVEFQRSTAHVQV